MSLSLATGSSWGNSVEAQVLSSAIQIENLAVLLDPVYPAGPYGGAEMAEAPERFVSRDEQQNTSQHLRLGLYAAAPSKPAQTSSASAALNRPG